jgi:hypothetical protein
MKKRIFWALPTILVMTSLILASCGSSAMNNPSATPVTTLKLTTTVTTTTATISTNANTTTTATGNWWDSLGIPQYGGTITVLQTANITQWDPYATRGINVLLMYLQQLDSDNWTISPLSFAFQFNFRPPKDLVGSLATGWSMPDVNDFVVTKSWKRSSIWQWRVQPLT